MDASAEAEQIPAPTTILIVDDHRSFADLLAGALNTVPGMVCIGTATTAAEGVEMAIALKPSVVVMDIEMPGEDGLTATRRIREVAPEAVIAIITAHRDPEWVSRAANAGATGFVPKYGSLAEMIEVLQHIGPGQMLVAPSTFSGPPVQASVPQSTMIGELTQREYDVLRCLGKGMHAKEIALTLGVTLHTCRGYIKTLHNKLGVRTQLEAVIKAQALGIIGQPDER
jgi:DNA-binding NarL/FixJ family response regulator